MPNWNQVLDRIREAGSTHDVIRREYLASLQTHTDRNIIAYYSGWLQKPDSHALMSINDNDKNGLMSAVHEMDRDKGLDLILHTPGGDIAATESIVDYLRKMFKDMRAVVPQLAMSAGTMIACSCRSIVMGKQSSLGPIDPQFGNIPAHGIVEEFRQAHEEIKADPSRIPLWQPIIAKYHPTLIGECQKAIKWSEQIVREWLCNGMLKDDPECEAKADRIINELGNHSVTLSHARHLSAERCQELGLVIESLESDDKYQDLVLSLHHAMMHTLASTPAFKIIENHRGTAFIQHAKMVLLQQQV